MWVVALIGIAGTTTGVFFLTERLADFFATDFFAERMADFLTERLADFFATDFFAERLAGFLAGALFVVDFFFAAIGDSSFSHTALNCLVNQRGER